MSDSPLTDYTALDLPEILAALFHPRKQSSLVKTPPNCREVLIPVEKEVHIGGRFHIAGNPAASILFFHGNGEIASDYDDLGPMYTQMGINFLVVDYRGYGLSDGQPTIAAMLNDCHRIFDYAERWLSQNSSKSPLVIMGRSLGSASALELAYKHASAIDGLIIESGFAYVRPLLQLLGVPSDLIDFEEEMAVGNVAKISGFTNPTLIIHAEFDHIIPFADGRKLFESSPAQQKTLLKIPHANHNDIFARGLNEYMAAIKTLISGMTQSG